MQRRQPPITKAQKKEVYKNSTALYDSTIVDFIRKNTTFDCPKFNNADDPELYVRSSLTEFQTNRAYVVNTARKSEKTGEHWLGFYKNDYMFYYFDPLGKNPHNSGYQIGNLSNDLFRKQSDIRVIYHRDELQNPETAVCGEYVCVFFKRLSDLLENMKSMKLKSDNDKANFVADQDLFENIVVGEQRQNRLANDVNILKEFKSL